uniref:Ig-like domain-containing protein n=1 Tax=Leptobrachium leishanense TaxID=445787 RepID=A0A8C5PRE8_9ANUR
MAFLRFQLLALLCLTGALEVFVRSPQKAQVGSDVLLQCTFSVTSPPVDPKFLAILWRYKDDIILRYDTKGLAHHPRVSFNGREAKTGNASISVANISLRDGGIYKCTVIYSPQTKNEEIALEILVPPVIRIPNKVATKGEHKTLLCSATGFHPSIINITWMRDGDKVLTDSQLGKTQRNDDGSYSVNSTVTIMPDSNHKNQSFTCRVHHDALHDPLEESFQLVYKDAKWNRIIVICGAVILVMIGVILFIFISRKLKNLRKAPGRFKLNDIKWPEKLVDGEEIILYCIGSNCAENTQVTWLEQRGSDEPEIIRPSSGQVEEEEALLDRSYEICDNREGFRSYSSRLRFIFSLEKHKGVKFICRFTSDNETLEKHFHCKPVYAKPSLVDRVKTSLCVSGEILYSLRLDGLYPRDIQILWTCVTGERQEIISSEEQLVEYSPLTFSVCSEARITEKVFTDPTCKVRVTWEHGSMDQPQSREMSILDPDFRWTPVVEAIQTPRLFHGSPIDLECKISEYFPDALTVNWLIIKDGSEEETSLPENMFHMKSKRESDLTYSCSTILTDLPSLETHQGVEYICRVQHPSMKTHIETRTGKLRVMAKPHPVEPIEMTLGDNSRVQFYLNLQGFYPKDIEITWDSEDGKYRYLLSPTNTVTRGKDQTFNVSSVCAVLGPLFINPQYRISVQWKHESLDVPEVRSWTWRDLPWRPLMEDIIIPELEAGKEAALTCKFSGYFPDSPSVRWIKKEKGNETEVKLPTDDYKVLYSKSNEATDKTFTQVARLIFNPHLERDQGAEFICRVTHPTLEEPIEKRTGPLLTGSSDLLMELRTDNTLPESRMEDALCKRDCFKKAALRTSTTIEQLEKQIPRSITKLSKAVQ